MQSNIRDAGCCSSVMLFFLTRWSTWQLACFLICTSQCSTLDVQQLTVQSHKLPACLTADRLAHYPAKSDSSLLACGLYCTPLHYQGHVNQAKNHRGQVRKRLGSVHVTVCAHTL